jgi:hypothetical protein
MSFSPSQIDNELAGISQGKTNRNEILQTLYEINQTIKQANHELETEPISLLYKTERILIFLNAYHESMIPEIQDKEYLQTTRQSVINLRNLAYSKQPKEHAEMVRRLAFIRSVIPHLINCVAWARITRILCWSRPLFFPEVLGPPHFFIWMGLTLVGTFALMILIPPLGFMMLIIPGNGFIVPIAVGRLRRCVTKRCHKIAATTGGWCSKYLTLKHARICQAQADAALRTTGYNLQSSSFSKLKIELLKLDDERQTLEQELLVNPA